MTLQTQKVLLKRAQRGLSGAIEALKLLEEPELVLELEATTVAVEVELSCLTGRPMAITVA